ncbi:MAG: hypothetical protein ACOYMR_05505 [Ilumatobacteraceae bacterium]
MNEPTTDEKIQHLVRAVLEAVDSRLASVRHELADFAADVEHQHHQILSSIAALERRVEHLEQLDVERAGATAGARERLLELQSRLTHLEQDVAHPADAPGVAAAPADPAHTSDLSELSRPLYAPGHATRELPIVTDPAIRRITAPPIPPTVAPVMAPTPRIDEPTPAALAPTPTDATADITDDIDIERLKRILDERLSHLTLPHPPEG